MSKKIICKDCGSNRIAEIGKYWMPVDENGYPDYTEVHYDSEGFVCRDCESKNIKEIEVEEDGCLDCGCKIFVNRINPATLEETLVCMRCGSKNIKIINKEEK